MASSINDTRKSYIGIFNEVRRKLGVNSITTLDQDKLGQAMIDYTNDIIAMISDYGDWQEMYREESFPCSASVKDYVFDTSVATKNIHEIQFGTLIPSMKLVTLDDIRRVARTGATGIPTQYAFVGVDNATTGNPRVRVFPTPVTAQVSAGYTFNIAYYKKPALITSAATSVIPEFPSTLIVQGLLALTLKDEERGNQSQQWSQEFAIFNKQLAETYDRYNGDTGSDTYFIPPRGCRRR